MAFRAVQTADVLPWCCPAVGFRLALRADQFPAPGSPTWFASGAFSRATVGGV